MFAIIQTASIGSQKVTEDLVAWAIGIKEFVRGFPLRFWMFIILALGVLFAFSHVPFGLPIWTLLTNIPFLFGCVLFVTAAGILICAACSANHNVNVLDTSD
jgi:carbon starvation protein CstA